MGVWAVVFVGMSAAGGVGDRHPGQWVPFWQRACEEGRPHACGFLAAKQSGLCNMGSGWACNEAGVLQAGLAGGERLRRIATVAVSSRRCTRSSAGVSLGSRRRAGTIEHCSTVVTRTSAGCRLSRTIRSCSGVARGRSWTGSPWRCTLGLVGRDGWTPANRQADDRAVVRAGGSLSEGRRDLPEAGQANGHCLRTDIESLRKPCD